MSLATVEMQRERTLDLFLLRLVLVVVLDIPHRPVVVVIGALGYDLEVVFAFARHRLSTKLSIYAEAMKVTAHMQSEEVS